MLGALGALGRGREEQAGGSEGPAPRRVRTSPEDGDEALVHESQRPGALSLRQSVQLVYFPLFSPEWP